MEKSYSSKTFLKIAGGGILKIAFLVVTFLINLSNHVRL